MLTRINKLDGWLRRGQLPWYIYIYLYILIARYFWKVIQYVFPLATGCLADQTWEQVLVWLLGCLFVCLFVWLAHKAREWLRLSLSISEACWRRCSLILETRYKKHSPGLLMFELFITRQRQQHQQQQQEAKELWLAKGGPQACPEDEGGVASACHMTPINRFNCSLSDASYLPGRRAQRSMSEATATATAASAPYGNEKMPIPKWMCDDEPSCRWGAKRGKPNCMVCVRSNDA